MAKAKGRRSSTADTTSAAKGKSGDTSIPDTDSLPKLSDSALAKLTKSIERKLQNKGDAGAASQKNGGSNVAKPGKAAEGLVLKTAAKTGPKKGKKRNRNGEVILGQDTRDKKNPPGSSKGGGGDVLEREIYAIGGSKEDYELLAEVESGSEIEVTQVATARSNRVKDEEKLRKDIAKMVKNINQPGGGVDEVLADRPSEAEDVRTRITSIKDVSKKKLVTTKSTRKEKFVPKDKQVPQNPATSSLVGLLCSSNETFLLTD